MEVSVCETCVKYAWKPMDMFKVNNKGTRTMSVTLLGVVFIFDFRCIAKTQLNISDGAFLWK